MRRTMTRKRCVQQLLSMLLLLLQLLLLPAVSHASSFSGDDLLLRERRQTVDNSSGSTGAAGTSQPLVLCNDSAPTGEYPRDVFTCEQKRNGAIALHFLGLLYMFFALAIICDEFFVPSLTVITRRLRISNDVAGATFMAAGGSAPELATSIIGTFIAQSDVGIGTIVGSAVFNILFVLSMCSFFSKGVLNLSWWPLFRDCCFYIMSLVVLMLSFRDSSIEWYESVILLTCYAAYVTFMKFNEKIESKVRSLACLQRKEQQEQQQEQQQQEQMPPRAADNGIPMANNDAAHANEQQRDSSTGGGSSGQMRKRTRSSSIPILHSASGRFRHGVFQLMIHTIDPIAEGSTQAKITKLQHVAEEVISRSSRSGTPNPAFNGEANGAGHPTARGRTLVRTFTPQSEDSLDMNSQKTNTTPDGSSPGSVRGANAAVAAAIANGNAANGAGAGAAAAAAADDANSQPNDANDDEMDEAPMDLSWPSTARERILYVIVFPIAILLWLTLADVRKPKAEKFFPWTFLGSILWIGAFTYFMTWLAKLIGEIIGIPDSIMGLTFLAAGTSVPDLITSVVVARQGLGDMAVSSSIGSNIFDVTIGLPMPWLIWSLVNSTSVKVNSRGNFCSILLLFGMLMSLVLSIAAFRWRMVKGLGAAMLVFYVVFLIVTILIELNFLSCILS